MTNYLLALDASSTSTGWAIYDLKHKNLIESGVYKPTGKNYKNFFARATFMKEEIAILKKKYNIVIVAVEDINVVISQKGAKNLAMADGIMLSNFTHDMVNFINVSTWRKHFKFGKMKSKEYKEKSKQLVLEKHNLEVRDDEADAILIGEYFLEQMSEKEE